MINKALRLARPDLALVFLFVFAFSLSSNAQFKYTKASNRTEAQKNKKSSSSHVLLPFFDDFSDYIGEPKSELWEESGAYINLGYAYNMPTLGVATLDCLDGEGRLYSNANMTGFSADTLSSKPIRLDSVFSPLPKKLKPSDSIYLSFAFQPGGGFGYLWEAIGSTPGIRDSLVLEFYSPVVSEWISVWNSPGISLDSIYAEDSIFFKFVNIPIIDTIFLQKDFRFRFRNYASLDANPSYSYISNTDQWNIDYIYLDYSRAWNEYSYRDIAFMEGGVSALRDYYAMPAKQFVQDELRSRLENKIINLFDQSLVSIYNYRVLDSLDNVLHHYDGGFENVDPYFSSKSFQESDNHAKPPFSYVFSFDKKNWTRFRIEHSIKLGVGDDNHTQNDKTVFEQVFENYFAYDDGSAENGFGIEPIRHSNLAIGFGLNEPDTITAVDIYFNSTFEDANQKPFYLCIWNSENGLPKDSLYKSSTLTPSVEGLNKFIRYYLDEPVYLERGGFFVSLETKGQDYLNIGFDRNTDASDFVYGNWANNWEKPFIKGSPMIRPYFGVLPDVGIRDEADNNSPSLEIYPNPSSGEIWIETSLDRPFIRIYDMLGRLSYESEYRARLDLSGLESGVYIIRLMEKNSKNWVEKKIILNN